MARKRAQAAAVEVADPLDAVAASLDQGDRDAASLALLPVLDRRAAEGERACALAAALLRLPRPEPGLLDHPLPAAVDRLTALVRRQQAQIQQLQDLIEVLL